MQSENIPVFLFQLRKIYAFLNVCIEITNFSQFQQPRPSLQLTEAYASIENTGMKTVLFHAGREKPPFFHAGREKPPFFMPGMKTAFFYAGHENRLFSCRA